jgi:hypothetical protein
MELSHGLQEFDQKLAVPLIADITRTLEVTCHKSGESNHGSNFLGNTVVLQAIEAVAQFINPVRSQDLNDFVRRARKEFKGLPAASKRFLLPKYSPDEALGSRLSKEFIKKYFDGRFKKEKVLGKPLCEVIWAFRNPHAHAFYPFVRQQMKNRELKGGVGWLYKNKRKRTGISIKELENRFSSYSKRLYRIDGDFFVLCPQILFVYLKQAIASFLQKVAEDKETGEVFRLNCERLSAVYYFYFR